MSRWSVPAGWEWATTNDIADVIGGGTPPSKDPANFTTDGVPWLTPADLTGYKKAYISRGARDLTEQGTRKSSARILPEGTVLYTSRAPIGYCAIAEQPMATNQGFKNLVLRGHISPEFVRHYLLGSKDYAESLSSGTTFRELSGARMKALEIPIAPLAEQRRIVAKIEALQERSRNAREALSEVGPLLEQFRQSLLAAAFRGDLTADWRAAHPDVEPATELLARIRHERHQKWEQAQLAKYEAKGKQPPKDWQERYTAPRAVSDDIDLPELPESWVWATVDELTDLITSGSRAWSQYYDRGDGTFIMAQNIRPGRLDFSKERQLIGPPPEPDSDRKRSQVEPGDLLVTIVGANTGDICPVECELPEHWVCQSVALLRLVLPEMCGLVLRYFLPGGDGRVRFDKVIYGQGRPHLGFDDLRAMPVPIPPLEEGAELLRVIADRELSIDAIQSVLPDSESALTQLDQSILAKAFRGELVPQHPNDEPASVLLERIREQRADSPRGRQGSGRKKRRNGQAGGKQGE